MLFCSKRAGGDFFQENSCDSDAVYLLNRDDHKGCVLDCTRSAGDGDGVVLGCHLVGAATAPARCQQNRGVRMGIIG